MSLVDQIFEQAKLGTAVDPSANPFATGVQLGQHQQQINQQQQQLAMEIAQAPLKQTLLQQDAALKALNIEHGLKSKQDEIEGEKAFAGLQSVVSDGLATKKPLVDIRADVLNYATKNQAVFLSDKWKPFSDNLDSLTKESDNVKARADANAARMRAAGASEFRAKPLLTKLDTMIQSAQTELADAQDPETGDPAMVPILQGQITSLQQQRQLEFDKVKNATDKNVNEAERIKAMQARTASINARTLELGNRLNRGDLALMNQKIKVIQDLPNSKMDFQAKMKAIEDVHSEFERKTKGYSQPQTQSPATTPQGSIPPKPPASNGEDHVYVKKDGKTYWVPRTELPQALREGYTQDTTYAE